MFLLQADDGIRDLVRSRGLRDVYKRQDENYAREIMQLFSIGLVRLNSNGTDMDDPNPVSYTHLTLPTIYSV
mgnify:CR=1 FL=1